MTDNPWTHDRLCRLVEFTISETKKHGINLDAERSHDVLFNFCEQDYAEVDERPLSDYIIVDRDGRMCSWDREKLLEYNKKALEDARNRLCVWCKEGEPINDDKDGVDRGGRYHFVHKWGIGLRKCNAVEQRLALDELGKQWCK
jgi:hypothetical protein